mmetsp:Transcript_44789/g.106188  ORF Transcript_44789/g.106188 Transcript_44789/m.106188 type:complete len:225 (+) Transcript_44789:314-988(+)
MMPAGEREPERPETVIDEFTDSATAGSSAKVRRLDWHGTHVVSVTCAAAKTAPDSCTSSTPPQARTGGKGTGPETETSGKTAGCWRLGFWRTKVNWVGASGLMGAASVRRRVPEACSQEPEKSSKVAAPGPASCRKHAPVMAHSPPASRSAEKDEVSPESVRTLPAGISRSGCSETETVLSTPARVVEPVMSSEFSHASCALAIEAGGRFHAPLGHSAEHAHAP